MGPTAVPPHHAECCCPGCTPTTPRRSRRRAVDDTHTLVQPASGSSGGRALHRAGRPLLIVGRDQAGPATVTGPPRRRSSRPAVRRPGPHDLAVITHALALQAHARWRREPGRDLDRPVDGWPAPGGSGSRHDTALPACGARLAVDRATIGLVAGDVASSGRPWSRRRSDPARPRRRPSGGEASAPAAARPLDHAGLHIATSAPPGSAQLGSPTPRLGRA